MPKAIETHEVKPQAAVIPQTKIVEAYGLRKCPKLVEQVAGLDIDVRINALSVLCEEFNNPYMISGCAQAGVIKVLASMVVDPDFETRERSSKALALAAKDANGLEAIIWDDAIPELLLGKNDPSEIVRGNIYECIFHTTRTREGIQACITAGVTEVFVLAINNETVFALKVLLLQALHNIVGNEEGLVNALQAGAVEVCIKLLKDLKYKNSVYADAAKTLAFICFDERGKEVALSNGAVPALADILHDRSQTVAVKAAVLTACMAITSTDEGKRQMLMGGNSDIVDNIIALLYEDDRVVKMNVIKVLANIAVYPPIRKILQDSTCVTMLKRIVANSGDAILIRHANIALDAVNWKP